MGLGYKNFELSVYAPISSINSAGTLGLFYNIPEKFGDFADYFLTLKSRFNFLISTSSVFEVKIRPGASLFIPVDDGGGDPELLIDLGVRVGIVQKRVKAHVAMNSTFVITEDNDFSDRSITDLSGYVGFIIGQTEIGLLGRLPVDDDFQQFIDAFIGLGIKYSPFKNNKTDKPEELGAMF